MFFFGKKYEYKFFVEGMSCGHCSARVENTFNENSQFSAKVNLEEKSVHLTSKRAVTEEEIKKIVEDTGFTFAGLEDEK